MGLVYSSSIIHLTLTDSTVVTYWKAEMGESPLAWPSTDNWACSTLFKLPDHSAIMPLDRHCRSVSYVKAVSSHNEDRKTIAAGS